MKILDSIKRGWKHEGFARIRKYMRKPMLIAFGIGDGVLLIGILGLLIFGELENFIVSMDLRYNSPVFIAMIAAFFAVQLGAGGLGLVLSLHKYNRSSNKGIFKPSYVDGNSYRALHEFLDHDPEKEK